MNSSWLKVKCVALALMVGILITTGCVNQSVVQPKKGLSSTISFYQAEQKEKLTPIKFTIWVGDPEPAETDIEDPIHKYIREELGVDIQYQYTMENKEKKLSMMLASRDYPDAIYYTRNNGLMADWVAAGALVETGESIKKYMPEVYASMKKEPWLYSYGKKGFYGILNFGSDGKYTVGKLLGVRYDAWKAIGAPEVKDLEDFYQAAKKMQDTIKIEDGRKVYAFGGWLGDWGLWYYMSILHYSGNSLDNSWSGVVDYNNNYKWTYFVDSEPYIYVLRYMNRAFREGYADPDAAIIKFEQYTNRLNSGLYLVNCYCGWMDDDANNARKRAGKPEQRYIPIPNMTFPGYTGRPLTVTSGQYGNNLLVYFTKNCKDTDEIIKRLSYLSTPEGAILCEYGPEGVYYTLDAQGMVKPKDDIIKMYKEDSDFTLKTGIDRWRLMFVRDYEDEKGNSYSFSSNKYVTQNTIDEVDRSILDDFGVKEYFDLFKDGMSDALSWDPNAAGSFIEFPHSEETDQFSMLGWLNYQYTCKLYLAKTSEEFESLLKEWKDKAKEAGSKAVAKKINENIKKSYDYCQSLLSGN